MMLGFWFFLVSQASCQYLLQSLSQATIQSQTYQVHKCSPLELDFLLLNPDQPKIEFSYPDLKPHYFVEIQYDLYFLGDWNSSNLQVFIDEQLKAQLSHNSTLASFPQFCESQGFNFIRTVKTVAFHQKNTLNLQFALNQFNLPKGASSRLGLRNIYLNFSTCHQTCLTCSGPLKTDCRACPQGAIKIKLTNECRCPESRPYIEDGKCTAFCSQGMYSDYYKLCYQEPNMEQAYSTQFEDKILKQWTLPKGLDYRFTFEAKNLIGPFKEFQKIFFNLGDLKGHTKVIIRLKLFLFQSWSQGEYILMQVGQVSQVLCKKEQSGFKGSQPLQVNFPATHSQIDLIYELSHNQETLAIILQSDTYPGSSATWGLQQFNVEILKCAQNCLFCGDVNKCSICQNGFLLYKGSCILSCPSTSTLRSSKCVDFDEELSYSIYLLNEFSDNSQIKIRSEHQTKLTKDPNQDYGFYFDGKRWLGGINQHSYFYYYQHFSRLPPHYQLRLKLDYEILNFENDFGRFFIISDTKFRTEFENIRYFSELQNRERGTVDEILVHNSSNYKLQLISQSLKKHSFRLAISNLILIADLCFPTCAKCTGPTVEQCSIWNYEPEFDKKICKCTQSLFFDFFANKCQNCPRGCLECDSETKCTQCNENFVLSGFSCYCALGYFEDGKTHDCLECPFNCQRCMDSKTCLDLQIGFQDCQNGVWNYGEQCDDGNNISRDGCSNCQIDVGWSCQSDLNQPSRCFECGPNCKSCSDVCIECFEGYYLERNLCNKCPIGCGSCDSEKFCLSCTVTSWLPVNGRCERCEAKPGFYLIDTECTTQCGDSILAGVEECDDGNRLNGDGCSSSCKLERGYTCSGSVCQNMVKPLYANVEYQNRTTTNSLLLKMNKTTTECSKQYLDVKLINFNQKDFEVYFDSIKSSSEDMFVCAVSFKFFKTVYDHDLIQIRIFKNPKQLRLLQESSIENDEYTEITIQARKEIYYSDESQEQAQAVLSIQNNFTIGLFLLGPVTLLLGGFNFFFSILDILAWINTLYYFNVHYPPNVKIIFENTAWENLNFLEMPFSLNQPDDDYYIESPLRFYEKGVDPLFLNNTLMIFLVWGLCLALYPLSKMTTGLIEKFFVQNSPKKRLASPKKRFSVVTIPPLNLDQSQQNFEMTLNYIMGSEESKPKYPLFFQKIYDEAKDYQQCIKSIAIKQLNLTYLDLGFASVLQLMHIDKAGNVIIFWNILLSILGIILCFTIIVIALYVSNKSERQLIQNRFQRDFGTLYEGIDITSQQGKLYFAVNLIRKLLFTIFMILFYYNPIFQTSMCFGAGFLNLLLLIYAKPFVSTIDMIQNTVPDVCIFLILGACTIFAFDDSTENLSEKTRLDFGWFIISMIVLSVGTQLYFIFRQFWIDLQEKYKMIKEYLSK